MLQYERDKEEMVLPSSASLNGIKKELKKTCDELELERLTQLEGRNWESNMERNWSWKPVRNISTQVTGSSNFL